MSGTGYLIKTAGLYRRSSSFRNDELGHQAGGTGSESFQKRQAGTDGYTGDIEARQY
jgi:hypothetical protein